MITINHGDQVVTLEEIRVTKPNTTEGTGTIKLVFVDERGLIYLIDRHNGLDILSFSAGGGEG